MNTNFHKMLMGLGYRLTTNYPEVKYVYQKVKEQENTAKYEVLTVDLEDSPILGKVHKTCMVVTLPKRKLVSYTPCGFTAMEVEALAEMAKELDFLSSKTPLGLS